MWLGRGALAAVVDTTQLALERRQIQAQQEATAFRGVEATEQLQVLQVQLDIARRAYERTRRLFSARAATAQQLDQTEREFRTLEASSAGARVAQIEERIARSVVRNPQPGTVLTTYANAGEVVQPGQPLYRIADLDTLDLRAYVTGDQLPRIRIGQPATVHVDAGEGALAAVPGVVTWISASAEFTPTPIQTREERSDLVYAVLVRVPNPEGRLKIGMPADVTFGSGPTGDAAESGSAGHAGAPIDDA
jgi:HlyD family secretion protein